jgi:hypothetical protein
LRHAEKGKKTRKLAKKAKKGATLITSAQGELVEGASNAVSNR